MKFFKVKKKKWIQIPIKKSLLQNNKTIILKCHRHLYTNAPPSITNSLNIQNSYKKSFFFVTPS